MAMRMPSGAVGDRFLHETGIAPVTRRRGRWLRSSLDPFLPEEQIMGKYVLGWFLGVPLIVLVAIYFIAH